MTNKKKNCPLCRKGRTVSTDEDLYDVEVVQIENPPTINLTTGEVDEAGENTFYALMIACDDQSQDFIPIEFCPWCGRKLKEK